MAARRQGRERPRRARARRGARAARLARLLRQRVPARARGLRRAGPRATDPDCPIADWRDAFVPAGHVGVEDARRRVVALAGALRRATSSSPAWPRPVRAAVDATIVQRGLRLLLDFVGLQRGAAGAGAGRRVHQRVAGPAAGRAGGGAGAGRCARRRWRRSSRAAESLHLLRARVPASASLAPALLELPRAHARGARRRAARRRRAPRLAAGRHGDRLLRGLRARRAARARGGVRGDRPPGLPRVAGAATARAAETLVSPLVRGMYDLVFAYEEGDPERPRFSAGLGLFLADEAVLRLQGRDLLEDARGDGRRRLRAAVPGAARRAACGSRWATGSSGCTSRTGAWPRSRSPAIRDEGDVLERVRRAAVLPGARAAVHARRRCGSERLRRGRAGHGARRGAGVCAELLERLAALARDGWRRGHRADAVAAGLAARGRGRARLAAPRGDGRAATSPRSTPTRR